MACFDVNAPRSEFKVNTIFTTKMTHFEIYKHVAKSHKLVEITVTPPPQPPNSGYDDNGDCAVHDPDRRHFPHSAEGGQHAAAFGYAETKATSPSRASALGGRRRW